MKHLAYFLVGATATGKSRLALALAQTLGLEIISADSMNVYSGMDIGTSKPGRNERSTVTHYGIDIRTPAEQCSVGTWLGAVQACMQKREQDGDTRPMIIVGGTGLYIKSLLKGLAPLPDIPSRVREHWSRVAESEGGLAALQNALRESSPSWFEALQDTHNRRRLQRALELVDCGMTSPPETWRHAPEDSSRPLTGLRMHRDALNQRIARRTHEMFEQGLVDEARALLKQFPRLSQTALKAIGYAEAFAFIRRELPLERAIEKTIVRTRRLAKRQRTWFEHQVNVDWVDVDSICADIAHDAILAKWRTEGPLPICQSTT